MTWFGGWHYAIYWTERLSAKKRLELFENLKDALQAAKWRLHNSEEVSVLDLKQSNFTAEVLYQSTIKRRLKKLVP